MYMYSTLSKDKSKLSSNVDFVFCKFFQFGRVQNCVVRKRVKNMFSFQCHIHSVQLDTDNAKVTRVSILIPNIYIQNEQQHEKKMSSHV